MHSQKNRSNAKRPAGRRPHAAARPARGAAPAARPVRTDDGMLPRSVVEGLTQALRAILPLDGPADVLLSKFFRDNHQIGSRSRGLIAEAAYFALRHLASISWAMAPRIPADNARLVALAALALQMGRGKLSDDCVGRSAAALEEILGKLASPQMPALVRSEVPEWLYALLVQQYPDHDALFAAMLRPAPLDLRVNLLKAKREDVLAELAGLGVPAVPTPMSPDGIRLGVKPGLTAWPMYKEGRVDVQDEGSQMIARLVAPRRGEMVCDFCAGAGGKTLALSALMRSSGMLYAFDVNEKRLSGMVPRMRRAGLTNVHPMAILSENDKRLHRLRGKMDRVLVDAPCSGTGTYRRNPDLKWRFGIDELERINAIQRSVLANAAKLVKAGGRLVYATCSILERENQGVVAEFLEQNPDFELLSAPEVLAKQGVALPAAAASRFGPYFAMVPHLSDTDGFFGAVLQRKPAERRPRRADRDAGSKAQE